MIVLVRNLNRFRLWLHLDDFGLHHNWPILRDDLSIVMHQSLLVHVDVFFMKHLDLLIGDAESFSVHQRLDGGELVQENEVGVVNLEVNGVAIRENQFVF